MKSTIFIVDDSVMKADDLKKHLTKYGKFEIKVFRCGGAFIKYITENSISSEELITNTELFLDWIFPWYEDVYALQVNGLRVLKFLNNRNLPIPTTMISSESVEDKTSLFTFVHEHIVMDYNMRQDKEIDEVMHKLFST